MDIDSLQSQGKLLDNLLLFGRLCQQLGMKITPTSMIEAAQALTFIDLDQKADVYFTLRALMVRYRRDMTLFDQAFSLFWKTPGRVGQVIQPPPPKDWSSERKMQFLPPIDAKPDSPLSDEMTRLIAVTPTHSTLEMLRYKHFADMSPSELSAAKRLMGELSWTLGERKTRRFTAGKGRSIDIRRALRHNMRTAGEMLTLPTRTHKIKPRPFVILCDISGSMERYTRLLLHFMHTLASSMYQVESFVFSTRLMRITRAMRRTSIDAALREIGSTVNVWGSGTRTDEALHAFNYRWGRRLLGHGAVVIMITDGWDRGNSHNLRREMARLQRSCYRLIWLNPLLGDANYAPLTQGARAMLPFVDDFLPVHNLASLETLARELWRVNWRRSADKQSMAQRIKS